MYDSTSNRRDCWLLLHEHSRRAPTLPYSNGGRLVPYDERAISLKLGMDWTYVVKGDEVAKYRLRSTLTAGPFTGLNAGECVLQTSSIRSYQKNGRYLLWTMSSSYGLIQAEEGWLVRAHAKYSQLGYNIQRFSFLFDHENLLSSGW